MIKLHEVESAIKAKGRQELIRHLKGERLSYKDRCLAKCFDCMGYYADGKGSCNSPDCPIYGVMSYRNGDHDD